MPSETTGRGQVRSKAQPLFGGLELGTVSNTPRRRVERQTCQVLPASGFGRIVLGLAESTLGGVDALEVGRGRAFGLVDLHLRGRESVGRVSNV